MKLHFLKTRWSDMIVLESRGHFALIDTGFEEQFEQLAGYLNKLGVKKLDFVLLTHFHRDHYGNVENIVKNFDTKKVYFKEYSGYDAIASDGRPADDEYRNSEKEKWFAMRNTIERYSNCCMVEELNCVDFDGYKLELFGTDNQIRKVYEDETYPETYHKILYSENQNSLGIFFEADKKTVFFGGDILDVASPHPLINYQLTAMAEKIGREIDIYKAAHHGTDKTGTEKFFSIFKPKFTVITNSMEYLAKYDAIEKIKKANPSADIRITDEGDVVIDLEK